jgi:hypothetical protein
VENDEHRGAERSEPRHQDMDYSYLDFLATHPPVFADVTDPLEVDSWLCNIESKFRLLHCIEYEKTLYLAQQLRGSARAWWASYIATLPVDHHVPWGEFCTAFRAHHLSVSLLCSKLKEFLDLELGNHFVFDYTKQFNTVAQYGTYHVDTNEKKANLYRAALTVHLQEHLRQLSTLTYNDSASAAIDQERLMKAVAEADGKKRKGMMPASTGSGNSSDSPLSTAWSIPHGGVSCTDHNSSSNHSSSNSSTVLLLHHCSRLPSGHRSSLSPATLYDSTVGRWGTLRMNAASPSKATRHKIWHPWSTSRGATRWDLHPGLAVPTTPPWMRFPQKKKC